MSRERKREEERERWRKDLRECFIKTEEAGTQAGTLEPEPAASY